MAEYQQNNHDNDFAPLDVAAELTWCDKKVGGYLGMSTMLVERLPPLT